MPAVLKRQLLRGVGFTATGAVARPIRDRLAELEAHTGTDVLIHGATALDDAWDAIHAHALPPGPRLIVLLAPPPGDAHAAAARAGLENLSRTLSIEWARHGIRPVTILQNGDADAAAELVAYLAGPAGGYFSGCTFTLRPPTGPRPSPPSGSPAPPRTPPGRSPTG